MGLLDEALASLATPGEGLNLFVPGRVCLLGEHSDWAGHYRRFNSAIEKGRCIVSGTNQGIHARVYPHPTHLVLRCTVDTGEVYEDSIPMEAAVLRERAQEGGFFAYCAGVAYCMMVHYQVRGLILDNHKTDLPVKKGLSSSAAVTVLVARAFNCVYDLKLTVRGEMELAYLGEIQTPSRCGRMDQCGAFGQRVVLMTFDGDHLDTEVVEMKGQLHLVIVDLKAGKDTKRILGDLNKAYPFPSNEVEANVHTMLGPINTDLVTRSLEALRAGDHPALGALLTEFQAQFDRHLIPQCPSQLTAPVLHRVLQYGPLQPHVYGGKGIGSQGDGCAQFLAKSEEDQQAVVDIVTRDLGMACLTLTLGAVQAVNKAVIPLAGFQSDLFPANVIGTGMLPVFGADGCCRPAILLLVEEAVGAGMEEVILVVRPEHRELYRRLFHGKLPSDKFNRLPPAGQRQADRALELGRRVVLVEQPAESGFGGAVLEAAERVGDAPFLLMLGDHLYQTAAYETSAQQVVGRYTGGPLVGLQWTSGVEVERFGAVSGQWDEKAGLLDVLQLAEKPTLEWAGLNLRPPPPPPSCGEAAGDFLTLCGLYVLPPAVFQSLAQQRGSGVAEPSFAEALDHVRREAGLRGAVLRGHRYDIGDPRGYRALLARPGP